MSALVALKTEGRFAGAILTRRSFASTRKERSGQNKLAFMGSLYWEGSVVRRSRAGASNYRRIKN